MGKSASIERVSALLLLNVFSMIISPQLISLNITTISTFSLPAFPPFSEMFCGAATATARKLALRRIHIQRLLDVFDMDTSVHSRSLT